MNFQIGERWSLGLNNCGDLWYIWPSLMFINYENGWAIEFDWLNWGVDLNYTSK